VLAERVYDLQYGGSRGADRNPMPYQQQQQSKIKCHGHREPLYYKGWVNQERDWDPDTPDTTRAGPRLGPLEETELGFTALPWAPLGWRQHQTYQDVFC
jgi:hypothetical protein